MALGEYERRKLLEEYARRKQENRRNNPAAFADEPILASPDEYEENERQRQELATRLRNYYSSSDRQITLPSQQADSGNEPSFADRMRNWIAERRANVDMPDWLENMGKVSSSYMERDEASEAVLRDRFQNRGERQALLQAVEQRRNDDWLAERDAKYGTITARPDFAQNIEGWEEFGRGFAPGADLYSTIANTMERRGAANVMTDEQKQIYTYLLNTEGEDAAEDYYEYISYGIHEQGMQNLDRIADKQTDTFFGKVGASAASVGANLASGVGALDIVGQNLRNQFGEYRPVDYNSPLQSGGTYAQAVREYVPENMGGAGRFLYGTGMSMADSLAAMAVGGKAGGVLLGMSAAQSAIQNAHERGVTDNQAMASGIFAGAAEMVFESIGIDNLFKMLDTGLTDSGRNIIKNIVGQMLAEGGEEVGTTVANTIMDAIIMADKSELQMAIAAYEAQGMSREEATRQAWKDWAAQLGLDFLGGMVSGGIMGGGGQAINTYGTGRNIQAHGQAQDVLDFTNEYGTDASKALAQRAGSAENASAMQLGRMTSVGGADAINPDGSFNMMEAVRRRIAEREKGTAQAETQPVATAETAQEAPMQTAEEIVEQAAKPTQAVSEAENTVQKTAPRTFKLRAKNKSGETLEITDVTIGQDTNLAFVTADGKEVSADDMDFKGNPKTMQIVKASANLNEDGARGLVTNYDGGDVMPYIRAYNLVYQRAQRNMSMDEAVQGVELPNNAAQAAYTAGQVMRMADEGSQEDRGGVIRSFTGTISKQKDNALKVLHDMFRAIGRTLVVTDTLDYVDADGTVRTSGSNAQFDPKTNRYTIALDAIDDAYINVAVHETVHDIKANSPADYDMLQEIVFEWLKDNGRDIEKMRDAQRALAQGRDNAYYDEEIVANTVPEIFAERKTFRRFMDEFMKRDTFSDEHRRVFMELVDSVLEFIQNALDTLSKYRSWSQIKGLRQQHDMIEAVRDAYFAGLRNASLQETQGEGETRNSFARETDTSITNEADRMLFEGASAQEIFKQTGLMQDASGIWVYEIDDSDMQVYPRGDAKLADDPQYQWYVQLAREGEFFSDEYQRLDRQYSVRGSERKLSDYVKHDALFERYPRLQDARFEFKAMGEGENASYSPKTDTITVSDRFKRSIYENDLPATLIHEIQHMIQRMDDRAGGSSVDYWQSRGATEQEARQLYRNTAGEIEARETSRRQRMTAQERAEQMPDLGEDRAVFADADFDYDAEIAHIKDQLREHQDELSTMNPVYMLNTVPSISKGKNEQKRWVLENLRSSGFAVDRKGFGVIEFKEAQINSGLNYAKTAEEVIAYLSIPSVLKRGIEITTHDDHKGRNFGTVTIAAPVVIGKQRGNVGIVVKKTKGNLFKALRILTPDGRLFVLDKNTEASSGPAGALSQEWDTHAKPTEDASKSRIANAIETVNPDIRYSAKDTTYMTAVESGDMETAQRMVDEAARDWGAYLNNPEANEVFKQDGEIRLFYHGTNTGDFTAFDSRLLGSSSGDLGWFGKGFYFAFSRDEAASYGGRVINAYLKMQNPFDYSQLYKFKGSDKGDSRYSRLAWLYNITKTFPDIVKGQRVWAYPNNAEEGTAIGWEQLASWMDRIQKEKEFSVEKVETNYGDVAYELRADPKTESFTTEDGETIEWTEYGMTQLFATEEAANNPINQIGAYLENVFGIDSIPRRSIEAIDFSGALQRAGYDGILQSMSGDEAVVFSPNQIKSADPVTYDDNGEVIPLSQRFNPEQQDIRYSAKDVDVEALQAENAQLRAANAELAAQMKRTKGVNLDERAIRRFAQKLVKREGSTFDAGQLANSLSLIYDDMANAENLTDEDAARIIQSGTRLARQVLERARYFDQDGYDADSAVREFLRDTAVEIPAEYDDAIKRMATNRTDYRAQTRGVLNIVGKGKGVSIDQLWQSGSEDFPTVFSENVTNPEDMVEELFVIAQGLKEDAYFGDNPYADDLDTAANILFLEMQAELMNIPRVQTLADKAAEAAKANRRAERAEKAAERSEQRRAVTQERYEAKKAELADVRARNAERREDANRRKHRDRVTRTANSLYQWAAKPNSKNYIPETMRLTVVKMLRALDMEGRMVEEAPKPPTHPGENATKEQMSAYRARETVYKRRLEAYQTKTQAKTTQSILWEQRMLKFADEMQKARGAENGASSFAASTDPDLPDAIRNYFKENPHVHLATMNATQMKELSELLSRIEKAVTSENKRHAEYRDQTIAQTAADTKTAWREREEANETVLGKISTSKLAMAQMDAMNTAHMLGGGAQSIIQELRDGEDVFIEHIEEAMQVLEPEIKKLNKGRLSSTKVVQAPDGKYTHAIVLHSTDGDVTLTRAQVMSLYCLNKREQARGHLYGGGIVSTRDGKKRTYRLTEQQVQEACGHLTDTERGVADVMQNLLSTVCAEWGNEATMELYGYKKFREKFYFPISTVELGRDVAYDPNASETTIAQRGFSQSTQDNATNAIYVGDVLTVVSKHVADMAEYGAYLTRISDAMRWLNYRGYTDADSTNYVNVKAELVRAFPGKEHRSGKDADKSAMEVYITDLIRSINGGASRTGTSNAITRLAKGAAVGANVSVAIQQPASYARAGVLLSARDLAFAKAGLLSKKERDLMYKYAPITRWKSYGFFQAGTGRNVEALLRGDDNFYQTLREKQGLLAEAADNNTWLRLWNACKHEQKRLHKDMDHNSDEFYRLVGKRLSEVIDRTQVVDSPFHRAPIVNDPRYVTLTAFQSEVFKSFGVAQSCTYDVVLDPKSKKAWKALGKGISAHVTAQILAGWLSAAWSAFIRDKDEEKDDELVERWLIKWGWIKPTGKYTRWEKFLVQGVQRSLGNLNPMRLHWIGNKVSDVIENGFAGAFFGNDSVDSSFFNAISKFIAESIKLVAKRREGEPTDPTKLIGYGLSAGSYGSGLGVATVIRDAQGIYRLIKDILQPEAYAPTMDDVFYYAETGVNEDDMSQVLAAETAKVQEDYPSYSADKAERTARGNLRSDVTREYRETYVQAFIDGDKETMQQIEQFMEDSGLYIDDNTPEDAIEKWLRDSLKNMYLEASTDEERQEIYDIMVEERVYTRSELATAIRNWTE